LGLDRLARQLLDTGEVTREQIEEARRTQSFFGGQIGSHLLKLGFVDEEVLGRALTEVTGAPYASREQLRVLADDVLRLGSSLRAQLLRLQICPFAIHDRKLRVAMLNPRDAFALAEVRTAAGRDVEPWVTCEYRLYQALERHFGVGGDRRQGVSLAPPAPTARRRSTDPPADADLDPTVASSEAELGLDGRPLHAEVDIDDQLFARATSDLGEILGKIGGASDAAPGLESDPWLKLESALGAAEDARGIAEALLDFSEGRARRAALFALTRDGARGIAGRGHGLETARLGALTLPVEPTSVLDAALKSAEFFFGVVPPLPSNRDLYGALGAKPPAMAMVLPITVKGRVVALWYLDDDDRPMTRPEIPRMRRAAAKAGLAFEIVLLRGKLRKI
jgi:hypothetical protein